MLTYRMAEVATRRRGAAFLPPIHPSLGAEVSFLKAERAMLRDLAGWCRGNLLPAFERVRAARDLTRDAEEWTWGQMEALSFRLAGAAVSLVNRILVLEAARHTRKFQANAKRTLGIDLGAVVRDEDLEGYFEQAGSRAANLITGLADDLRKRIKDRTIAAVLSGDTSASFRKMLAEEFGIADRRAQLIARDQIGKVNSDLNRIRHQQAGITDYEWMTAHDERVRSLHRALNGKRFKYGEPTGAEDGLPPGQPIRCRCVARAIVEF